MTVSRRPVPTFVSEGGLDGNDVAMLRLLGNSCCRIIIFFSHVVPDLRLCRNASTGKTWRIYDLVVITTKRRRGEGERARQNRFKIKARSSSPTRFFRTVRLKESVQRLIGVHHLKNTDIYSVHQVLNVFSRVPEFVCVVISFKPIIRSRFGLRCFNWFD